MPRASLAPGFLKQSQCRSVGDIRHKMSALRFLLVASLAVFFVSQVLAVALPEQAAEGDSALKTVEAKVSVAFDDLKKNVNDLFQNISSAFQAEMAKHPEANQMYNQLYNNITSGMQDLVKQVQEVTSTATAKP